MEGIIDSAYGKGKHNNKSKHSLSDRAKILLFEEMGPP